MTDRRVPRDPPAAPASPPEPAQAPGRCERCGEEYQSLMNPRWRGHPWQCGKCGAVNPGVIDPPASVPVQTGTAPASREPRDDDFHRNAPAPFAPVVGRPGRPIPLPASPGALAEFERLVDDYGDAAVAFAEKTGWPGCNDEEFAAAKAPVDAARSALLAWARRARGQSEALALSESAAVARQIAADSEAQSWRQRAEAAERKRDEAREDGRRQGIKEAARAIEPPKGTPDPETDFYPFLGESKFELLARAYDRIRALAEGAAPGKETI